MRIEWSALAVQDREWIFTYIEQHNPPAAVAIDERISAQIERLARHAAVRVLRIVHESQQWPDKVPS